MEAQGDIKDGSGLDNGSVDRWSRVTTLLANYPYHIDRIRPIDAVTAMVYTSTRTLEARIVPKTSAKIRLLLTDWMADGGFRSTQRFIRTLYGDREVPLVGQLVLYVTDALVGEPLRAHPDEAVSAAAQLANLHRAMLGFHALPSLKWGDEEAQPADWDKECLDSAAFFCDVAKDERIRAHPSLVEWNLLLEEQCLMIHRALQDVGYPRLLAQAQGDGQLAWSGYTWHAQRRVPPTFRMVTLQLTDPSFGGRMVDLATFCSQVLELCDEFTVMQAISAYKSEFLEDESEWKAALAYVALPRVEQQWMQGYLINAKNADSSNPLSAATHQTFSRRREKALTLLSTLGVQPRF